MGHLFMDYSKPSREVLGDFKEGFDLDIKRAIYLPKDLRSLGIISDGKPLPFQYFLDKSITALPVTEEEYSCISPVDCFPLCLQARSIINKAMSGINKWGVLIKDSKPIGAVRMFESSKAFYHLSYLPGIAQAEINDFDDEL